MVRFFRERRARLGDLGMVLIASSAGALGTTEAVALALIGAILVLTAG